MDDERYLFVLVLSLANNIAKCTEGKLGQGC
jgi:hypothetical protein